MPAWLSIVLWKILLPDLILWAQKNGYMDFAQALAAKGAVAVVNEVRSLKFYDQYPGDPPSPTGTTNMTTGDGTPVT